jgi:membrane fusion protein (multidrug efflux system)
MNRAFATAILLAALPIGAAWGQAAPGAPPPAAGYITAASQPVYDTQTYVGRIQAREIVRLQARVTGYLTSQAFTDGQVVHAGELLYVIEQPPYQALVDQAQAAVAQAQAQARNAQLSLTRAQALLHSAAGQQSQVDQAQATALSDEAAILAAQAQLQTAQINFGYTEIRAPIDGVIGATTVNPGNVVGPQSGALATIVSSDPIYVSISLPMADAIKLRRQASSLDLLVQLPGGAPYPHTGKVDFINNQVAQATDTLTWRGSIANPDGTLTDGEFVNVQLRAHTATSRIVIPLAAIIADQLGNYVLEIGPGNLVARRNITLGAETDTDATVLAGIAPGDKIITEGIQRLHPGLTVSPQPAA